jgi:hypothetical protein
MTSQSRVEKCRRYTCIRDKPDLCPRTRQILFLLLVVVVMVMMLFLGCSMLPDIMYDQIAPNTVQQIAVWRWSTRDFLEQEITLYRST